MVANVETMMSVVEVPWHKEGRILNAPPTAAEGIEAAGLNWTVEKRPIYAAGAIGEVLDCDEHRAIVRTTDRKVLGVVGDGHEPVQNRDAFDFMDPMIKSGKIALETAGSLDGGKRIWVMGKVGEADVTPGDTVAQYLLFTTGHTGAHGNVIKPTGVRVVCQNTVNAALADGVQGITLRHTASVHARLREAAAAFARAERGFSETVEAWRSLAAKRCRDDAFEAFVAELVPTDEKVSDTRREIVREGLRLARRNSPGSDMPGVRGTWWAAYNAVTWHVTHGGRERPADKRLDSMWNGAGATLAKRAYDLALAA